MLGRLRPYLLHAYLLTYTPLLLVADAHTTSIWQQYGLGALTFVVLFAGCRILPRHDRLQVWLLVVCATGFEVLGSLILGIYVYRFHNLPLYVPPGHGLVYLFGLTAMATPLLRRHLDAARWVVTIAAGAWAVAGLFLLPALTGRLDAVGALCFPIFAWFVFRSPRAGLFIAIFVAVAELELVGTAAGTWTWLAIQPYSHIPSGNPPSVIAGGYCVIDASVLVVLAAWRRLSRLRGSGLLPDPLPPGQPAEA